MNIEPRTDPAPGRTRAIGPLLIGLAFAAMLGTAVAAFVWLDHSKPKAEVEVTADPLLIEGSRVYLDRCVGCHGTTGKGDGPTARILKGRPPGDLTAPQWRHGAEPDQLLALIARGVKDAEMPGFASVLGERDRRAVAAYVLALAKRPIPESLRSGPAGEDRP